MAEYIDREAACKAIMGEEPDSHYPQWYVDEIKSIPATYVTPVRHGKWKYYHKKNIAVCTECSFEWNLDDNFGRAVSCPNCGARMGGND